MTDGARASKSPALLEHERIEQHLRQSCTAAAELLAALSRLREIFRNRRSAALRLGQASAQDDQAELRAHWVDARAAVTELANQLERIAGSGRGLQ